jgi:hypothetical protein
MVYQLNRVSGPVRPKRLILKVVGSTMIPPAEAGSNLRPPADRSPIHAVLKALALIALLGLMVGLAIVSLLAD